MLIKVDRVAHFSPPAVRTQSAILLATGKPAPSSHIKEHDALLYKAMAVHHKAENTHIVYTLFRYTRSSTQTLTKSE